ncbi:oxygenase MpaB family protein [Bradyrhizobium sp.]|jgi:hypothetical protein|uniref:oxygenase MpaB family protein n=1 Tax=Bradyrhizobium sp. TaxID=376 RepID=UPI003D13944F
MKMTLEQVAAKVASQKELLPSLYGDVDFGSTPQRFTDDLRDESVLRGELVGKRAEILSDKEQVGRIRAYTMLGDIVADAYAALMPEYGFKGLTAMLADACDRGVENVEGAPQELIAFIRDMEHIPDWLDMNLVREGARIDRNSAVNFSPYVVRGAFIATFMNKYAALPMALTGTLSNQTAANRVKETASFFATTVLPGGLDRYGAGFKAAALVRLMHSMVRFNALRRSKQWDIRIYGIPIPQVDQMPAGLIPIFLLASSVLSKGRKEFTPQERARVELARYRCYLLGLPEDLLADTPQGIVKVMSTRHATLRNGYDDNTCGELLRATMAAYLPSDRSVGSRIFNSVEQSFAKVFFVRTFLSGDEKRAAQIGVHLSLKDRLQFAAVGLFVFSRMAAYSFAMRIPGIAGLADRILIRKLNVLLKGYGHAEYTTDVTKYKPASIKAAGA